MGKRRKSRGCTGMDGGKWGGKAPSALLANLSLPVTPRESDSSLGVSQSKLARQGGRNKSSVNTLMYSQRKQLIWSRLFRCVRHKGGASH